MDADEERSYRDDLCELVQNKKPLITMLSQGTDEISLHVWHHTTYQILHVYIYMYVCGICNIRMKQLPRSI